MAAKRLLDEHEAVRGAALAAANAVDLLGDVRRVGRGVAVLLKVYANCIDDQAGATNQRISDALDEHDSE